MSTDNQLSLLLRVKMAYPGFSLDVDRQLSLSGVTGLFGPSGGGKSTLLRIIAGLMFATVLTLVLVPSLYMIAHDAKAVWQAFKAWVAGPVPRDATRELG